MFSPCICSPPIIPPYWTTDTGLDIKIYFMDFEQYWTLIGGETNFANRKEAAREVWNAHPLKQMAIIEWLKRHGQYPGRNPYFFILDFQLKRQQVLSYADYYAKFSTTEEREGWKMVNPTGNKVIYVKTAI